MIQTNSKIFNNANLQYTYEDSSITWLYVSTNFAHAHTRAEMGTPYFDIKWPIRYFLLQGLNCTIAWNLNTDIRTNQINGQTHRKLKIENLDLDQHIAPDVHNPIAPRATNSCTQTCYITSYHVGMHTHADTHTHKTYPICIHRLYSHMHQ